MFQPLDYLFFMIIGMLTLYAGVWVYIEYFMTNKNTIDGSDLVNNYLKLEKARNGKK